MEFCQNMVSFEPTLKSSTPGNTENTPQLEWNLQLHRLLDLIELGFTAQFSSIQLSRILPSKRCAYEDRFLVANTPESILLGDLQTCRGLNMHLVDMWSFEKEHL